MSQINSIKPEAGFDTMKNALEKWEMSEGSKKSDPSAQGALAKSAYYLGGLAVLAAGGYLFWRNRASIQSLFSSAKAELKAFPRAGSEKSQANSMVAEGGPDFSQAV